jgi:hypothetical protein
MAAATGHLPLGCTDQDHLRHHRRHPGTDLRGGRPGWPPSTRSLRRTARQRQAAPRRTLTSAPVSDPHRKRSADP